MNINVGKYQDKLSILIPQNVFITEIKATKQGCKGRMNSNA